MLSPPTSRLHRHCTALLLAALWLAPALAQERPLVLLIQPTLGEETNKQSFQPLADYLASAAGAQIIIVTKPNFLAHWDTVRRNAGYDLVLDDAHFTDYRVQKFGFYVLAKMRGSDSYSLLVSKDKRVMDPLELAGKAIASFGPPSIGATRLSAMFTNPARRPSIIDIANAREGLELLRQQKVAAAMLPTTYVGHYMAQGEFRVVMTTEPTPQMALSASPRVHPDLRQKISAALTEVGSSPGKRPPPAAGVDRFETATAAMYDNQSRILKEYWGY